MRICKFSIIEYADDINWGKFPILPSVCLFVFEKVPSARELNDIVEKFLHFGVIEFIAIGGNSNLLEDAIDFVLEDGDDSLLNVATTKYPGSGLADAMDYAVNTVFRKMKKFQCFIVFDDFYKKHEIIREVEAFKANSNLITFE